MNLNRVVNLQGTVNRFFPQLPGAVTAAMALKAQEHIITSAHSDSEPDPFPAIVRTLEWLAPRGLATPVDFALLALILMEEDSRWLGER